MDFSTLSKEDITTSITQIEGWLGEEEIKMLYNLITNLKNNASLVEIGSWCGRSLSLITLAARKAGNTNKIFSIDPFLTSKNEDNGKFPTFKKNLEDLKIWNEIIHIKEKSQIAGIKFNENIEFIFIDGFHKYESVKEDFKLFSKQVIDGGYIALHDVGSYYGPTKLTQEILESGMLKVIDYKNSTFLFQNNKPSNEEKNKNLEFLNKLNNILKNRDLAN